MMEDSVDENDARRHSHNNHIEAPPERSDTVAMPKRVEYSQLSQSESESSVLTPITQPASGGLDDRNTDWEGNQPIKVGVRLRPLSPQELKGSVQTRPGMSFRSRKSDSTEAHAWTITKSAKRNMIAQHGVRRVEGRSIFQFDDVFDEGSSTNEVYDAMVKPILKAVMSGRNGTIFAYGQTSSGKTYTMQGSDVVYDDTGIIQMVASDVFQSVAADTTNRDYTVRVSFIEIYNEKVKDLLRKESRSKDPKRKSSSPTLTVREDPKRGGVYVDCHETTVEDAESVVNALQRGNQDRSWASTTMNDHSSRSHAIFRITVESRERIDTDDGSGDGRIVRVSTLNLVDLAGSESGHQSGSNGLRKREGGNINQSLLSLSQVIHALSKPPNKRPTFINYRDSKLTRILQPALSGNAFMAVLCCITASKLHLEETRSTLRFASRAQLVQTTAKVNEILDDSVLIKKLQRELEEATRALKELEKRETTLESIIFSDDNPDESASVIPFGPLLNTSAWTQTSLEEGLKTPGNKSGYSIEANLNNRHVEGPPGLTSSPNSRLSTESEPCRVSVTPESGEDTSAARLNRSMESGLKVILPVSNTSNGLVATNLQVNDESVPPLHPAWSLQRVAESLPSEVVILNSRPPPPSISASHDNSDARLQSKLLQDADQRTQFLQSKLDATEDLVESLFKDIESARRCVHELVFKNVNMSRRLERMRRRLDEQAQQCLLLKHAIYCALFFFLCGQHEVFLATAMFLWLTLEVIT